MLGLSDEARLGLFIAVVQANTSKEWNWDSMSLPADPVPNDQIGIN